MFGIEHSAKYQKFPHEEFLKDLNTNQKNMWIPPPMEEEEED